MNYSKACEIAGLTTPKSIEENARLAGGMLNRLDAGAPLKLSVALQTILNAA